MADDIEYREATKPPKCPHCDEVISTIEYRRQKINHSFLTGYGRVMLLQCSHCAKILGTQPWE